MRRFPFSLPARLRLPAPPALSRAPLSIRLPLPRLPLPITAATILSLLLLPALGLSRWPRPRAEGLEQLMGAASLLQSFPATPERPVPDLWLERFGSPGAERLWGQQRRNWWQFWGPHADGAPFLAISGPAMAGGSAAPLPPNSLKVGDLLVVAPDPLSRQLLQDRLRPQQRRSRGLERRCLQRLEQEQAVFWNPSSLGVIVGPVAPLMQRFQEGCLALELESGALRWQGEAAAVDGLLSPAAEAVSPALGTGEDLPPLPSDQLMELEGASLEQLLQGLLSRQLIREPLGSRYGLDETRLPLLRQAPFRLRLRPQPSGPFQASLELQLVVGEKRREWDQVLTRLTKALRDQGLRDTLAPLARAVTWSRKDDVVVGGWRWIASPGAEDQLLFFLGPAPLAPVPMGSGKGERPSQGELALRVRPAALDQLGLLPPEMPQLVRRSDQLWINVSPVPGAPPSDPVSRLRGRLQLAR